MNNEIMEVCKIEKKTNLKNMGIQPEAFLSTRLYSTASFHLFTLVQSYYSSVGIALGYGLDDRRSRVRFPAGAGNFYLHQCVQNGSGAHPASHPIGTSGSFPEGKAAGA
jgi:hypothetical protein